MDKKKIVIVSHALELGGAERSLIGLLEAFDYSKYQVDLFLCRHEGELLKHIPKEVNLLPEIASYTVLARPMKQVLKEGHFLSVLARIYAKTKAKQFDRKMHHTDSAVEIEYSQKYIIPFWPKINNTEYDLAISFLTPHYIVPNKIQAKKKLAWIHTDYTKIDIDRNSELQMWNQYDFIASISDAVTEGFDKTFPELKNKIVLIENILPAELIKKQAAEVLSDSEMLTPERGKEANEHHSDQHKFKRESKEGCICLLSVGRFSYAKNFDNIPEICAKIVSKGIHIKWYLIGYGNDENLIREKIKEFHMENHVIILGKKENPYPYMKACDVYVQPSRYEGKCVSVREAQLLDKPVIITDYATANSQLQDRYDGVIVPMEINACAEGICKVLSDSALLKALVNNCKANRYDNQTEINKLYKLID